MSSKKRILHVIKSLGRGGAEMLLPETLKLHHKDKFEFYYIYFLPWKDQMVASITQNGGTVKCLASNNNLQLILKIGDLISFIREQQIDLIHAHLPWAGILARVAGVITHVPVIYTEHNKQERYHLGTRIMNLLTLGLSSRVIAVSNDVRESIYKYKPKLKVSVTTIVNGVNTDHFNPETVLEGAIREKFNIPENALIIGTIAVFRFQKRLDLWMEIASKILKSNPDTHFVIVGDGPLKKELLKKREQLELNDRIHLPGLEREVRPYLKAFDIYMMTSIFEGLPVALLEAMSMKCPVISTDAGGVKEVIRHEIDGFLCAVDKPEKLIDFANHFLKNELIRRHFAEQSRNRVLNAFSMGRMVNELERTYMETVP